MLLRQLQRPSSRPVAATAWRLANTALLHGSSRQLQSPTPTPTSSPSPSDEDDSARHKSNSSSLFAQLFPEEAKLARTRPIGKTPKNPWPSEFLDEPPLLAETEEHLFDGGSADGKLNNGPENASPDRPTSDTVPLRAQSMLILSAASKHLSESDFIRHSPRSTHVEGWVQGLSRVIQARDPDTLQPLGHYFLLFDSEAAAIAYRDEVERLWQLAKAHVPGAHHGREAQRRMPVPAGLKRAQDGRDVAAAISSFTLVPPSQRYHLELATGQSKDKIEDLDIGHGTFMDRLTARAGSKHLVLVTVDGIRISVDTLRQAIKEDGAERNLAWRVTDLENGILPFGKSILKKHDKDTRTLEESLLDQAARTTGKREANGEDKSEAGATDDKYRRYHRFIVPFADNAEAHRFVRSWHRRQLKLNMSLEGRDQVSWDETGILNTSVLW
ncbi:hypothetical protein GGS26DRAFT_404899 [Hypomontagnella submonticulosa]|nr:hypothetical protein GGS26DRAFT_404899 [Hypomontagnella submonticulosa]